MNSTSALSRPVLISMWLLLALYVSVLPISGTVALRNVGFAGLVVVFLYTSIRYHLRPDFPFVFPWSIYALIALVSLCYAVDPIYSRRDFVAEFGYGTFVLMFAATMGRRVSLLNGLIALFVGLNFFSLLSLMARYPFSEIASTSDPYRTHIDAFSRVALNPNYLISVMPMICLGAWRFWQANLRTLAIALVVLVGLDTVALLFSGNRQCLVALVAASACVLPFLPRHLLKQRLAALVIAGAIIAGFFLFQLWRRQWTGEGILADVGHDPRWALWQFSLDKIRDHPWYGGGFGRAVFDKLYPNFVPENGFLWHAHNMFLNRGIQMGIPGMAAFAWLWIAVCRQLISYARSSRGSIAAVGIAGCSVAFGVLVKNLTDDFFLRDPALLFWLQMGVIVGEVRHQQEIS